MHRIILFTFLVSLPPGVAMVTPAIKEELPATQSPATLISQHLPASPSISNPRIWPIWEEDGGRGGGGVMATGRHLNVDLSHWLLHVFRPIHFCYLAAAFVCQLRAQLIENRCHGDDGGIRTFHSGPKQQNSAVIQFFPLPTSFFSLSATLVIKFNHVAIGWKFTAQRHPRLVLFSSSEPVLNTSQTRPKHVLNTS